VWHLLKDLVHTLTHADSSILRTTKELFCRPGELTRAWFQGPRRRYIGPVQFFLICNVVFFLVQGALGFNVLRADFERQMKVQPYSRWVQGRGERFLTRANAESSAQELKADYDRHSEHLSKSLVVVLVPAFALVLTLLFAGKGRFYVEHVVFSLHFYAAFLLAVCVFALLFTAGTHVLAAASFHLSRGYELLFSCGVVAIGAMYLLVALRRFYQLRLLPGLWRAVLLGTAIVPLLILYRWFLFYATIWTM
jgi:hypothetical protein